MKWYKWSFWRIYWSMNAGGTIIHPDSGRKWHSILGTKLFFMTGPYV